MGRYPKISVRINGHLRIHPLEIKGQNAVSRKKGPQLSITVGCVDVQFTAEGEDMMARFVSANALVVKLSWLLVLSCSTPVLAQCQIAAQDADTSLSTPE